MIFYWFKKNFGLQTAIFFTQTFGLFTNKLITGDNSKVIGTQVGLQSGISIGVSSHSQESLSLSELFVDGGGCGGSSGPGGEGGSSLVKVFSISKSISDICIFFIHYIKKLIFCFKLEKCE
jgi:hypothetical protein